MRLEYFAISTQGPWHTAATENEYDIRIDVNGDGTPDFIAYNTRLGRRGRRTIMAVNLCQITGSTCPVIDQRVHQRPPRQHGHGTVRQ